MGAAFRRRQKLVKPGVQLRLVLTFAGCAAVALFLQFLFLGARLTQAVAEVQGPSGDLAEQVPRMLLEVLAVSLIVCMPVLICLGVLLTHRIAGPIHRCELFLMNVAAGKQIGPCKIRKGDELQSLVDAVNEATAPLRQRVAESPDPELDAAPEPEATAGSVTDVPDSPDTPAAEIQKSA